MASVDVSTGNVTGLIAFLDFMIRKGYGTRGAISPLQTASRRVFSTVEGEEVYEAFDVRAFDVDEYLGRFEKLSLGQYTADSLGAYRLRFKKAVEWYRAYLADPNWKPPTGRAMRNRTSEENGERPKRPRTSAAGLTKVADPAPTVQPQLIAYPFPLKSGQLAQLHLPAQLHREDADRLNAFVRALVFEQPAQLPPGEEQ